LSPQSTVTPLRPPLPADAEPEPDELELLRDAIGSRIGNPQGLLSMVRRTSSALYGFYERRRQDQQQAGGSFLDAPRMRWNAPIDAERNVAFARLEVADVRLIRKAFRVTGNEIVLALCAGALRAYLDDHGELPYAPLIAACPVAVRHQTQGDNRISAMVTSLATNIVDPVARLAAIAETTRHAKAEHDALGGDLIANWAELAFPAVFHPLVRAYSKYGVADWHRPLYNLAISNVPGPRKPLFFDGAELVQAYPLGPVIEGVGLNITVMSYVDHLGFGLVAARKRLPDLDQLAACLGQACQELVVAAKTSADTPAIEKKGA
jgi:WS/DGAT/MGAT family acyltransferase